MFISWDRSIKFALKNAGMVEKMIFYKCYGNHDKNKTTDVDKLKENERIYYVFDILNNNDIVRDNEDFDRNIECPICRSRKHLVVDSMLYWCNDCKVPLYEQKCSCCGKRGRKFVKDCRIVFPEEKILLEILLGKKKGEFDDVSIWNGSGNIYYADGKNMKIKIRGLINQDTDKIREKFDERIKTLNTEFFDGMVQRFITANKNRFNDIDDDAIVQINKKVRGYEDREIFISFSGGKDSTVVADLVKRATGRADICHLFGDTTLEFPETYNYIKEYKEHNPKTLMISSKNKDKNFEDLCKVVGPPSRVMRWCCTIFKTGAINRKIETIYANKVKVLSFQGIRRSESNSRNKYDRVSESSKISKQEVCAPIISWYDFDVWLYILTRNIIFNRAYRLGYSRVGCWCCPNNSSWSEFLSKIFMKEQYEKFHKMLIDFAKSVGKKDPDVYVDSGNWKARQGGNGVKFAKNSIVNFERCVKESLAFNYELTREITPTLYEMFKPFGKIVEELGDKRLGEVYVVDKNSVSVIRLQGKMGTKNLKILVDHPELMRAKDADEAKRKLDCQITKYQMCLGCRACESVCRFGAIKVKTSREGEDINRMADYCIDDEKCKRCQECVGHFSVGCYMRKVLSIKR